MAALQSIRNHPIILTSVLGGGLILMIIMFGFDDYNGLFQGDRDTVINVNGEKVDHTTFQMALQQKSDFFKAMQGIDANNSEVSRQLNTQTFNELVQEKILEEQYEGMGIGVCKSELSELLSGTHISPVMAQIGQATGQNPALLGSSMIAQESAGFPDMETANIWNEIKEQVIKERKSQKLSSLLNTAIKPNKLEIEDAFANDNYEVSFEYVALNAAQAPDSLVTVTDAEIKKYYEANKQDFKITSNIRDIDYIAVEINPSDEDRNSALKAINASSAQFTEGSDIAELVNSTGIFNYVDAHLNNNIFRDDLKVFVENGAEGDVMTPTIYNGDILNLVSSSDNSRNSHQNEYYYTARIMSKVTAPDSVKAVIYPVIADKADSIFQVVKDGSLDENAQWFTEAQIRDLSEDIRAKIFTDKPARTLFTEDFEGNKIVIKLLDKTANVEKSKVAILAERIDASAKTRREAFGKLNEFQNKFNTVAQMEDSAIANGYRLIPTSISTTNYNIGQVSDAREAVRFAFNAETNEISNIFECGDYLLLVAPTSDVENGYLSVNNKNVVARIENQLLAKKQVEYLINNKLANVDKSSLEACAAALGTEVQTASRVSLSTGFVSGLGAEPKVVAEAVKATEGQIIGPIAGSSCAVILKVTSAKGKELTFEETTYANKVATGVYRNPASTALNVLMRNAEVIDNRLMAY